MAPVSIRLDRISKRFDHTVKGEVYAVREVSLAVADGELLDACSAPRAAASRRPCA